MLIVFNKLLINLNFFNQENFAIIDDLEPNTKYSVQIESRHEASRYYDYFKADIRYILYAKSAIWEFVTDGTIGPITDLKLGGSLNNALKIIWNPPLDPGAEMVAQRIECVSLNPKRPINIIKAVEPDVKKHIFGNLEDKTKYKITVTAITERFLKKYPDVLEKKSINDGKLQKKSIEAESSGYDPAYRLTHSMKTEDTLTVKWERANVYGSTKKVYQILCYQAIKEDTVSRVPLELSDKTYSDLKLPQKNTQYKIWIETVVLVKLNFDAGYASYKAAKFKIKQLINNKQLFSTTLDHYKELAEYRCVTAISEALKVSI